MNKALNIAVSLLTWGILSISLVYLLCIWNTMPDTIGVHFASDGSFDVFDSKCYIAYPYAAGFGFLFLLEKASAVCRKSKSGMKINQTGERKLQFVLAFLINILKLYDCLFFAKWAHCVMVQRPMNMLFSRISAWAIIIVFLLFVCSVICIRVLYRVKFDDQEVS